MFRARVRASKGRSAEVLDLWEDHFSDRQKVGFYKNPTCLYRNPMHFFGPARSFGGCDTVGSDWLTPFY